MLPLTSFLRLGLLGFAVSQVLYMAWPTRQGMRGFAAPPSQQKRGQICKESPWSTLQGTNISPYQGTFEDDFAFPQVGYVNSLEGNSYSLCNWIEATKNTSFHGGTGFLFCETCGFCSGALEVYHHLPHRIHGTGIFTCSYHKFKPLMQVNMPYLPYLHGSVMGTKWFVWQECLSWLLDVQKQLGDQRPTKEIRRSLTGEAGGLDASKAILRLIYCRGGGNANVGFAMHHGSRSSPAVSDKRLQMVSFFFPPRTLGKWSKLTNAFHMGWFNHQVISCLLSWCCFLRIIP